MDFKNITVSSIFLVPTLQIEKEKLKEFGFLNGYIQDINRDIEYEDSVFVLFKPENHERFMEFVDDEYEKGAAIIEDYDYEGGFVVLVYKLNMDFERDFLYIKQGKYSKTSDEFQALFPENTKVITKNDGEREELSIQHRIFRKTQDLIKFQEERMGIDFRPEMEVWEGWNKERETLDINKFKK